MERCRWREAALLPLKSPTHTGSQFQPTLYSDTFDKRLVMGDDDERAVISTQPGLDRSDRADVEMVGRLAEDQERRRAQKRRNGSPYLHQHCAVQKSLAAKVTYFSNLLPQVRKGFASQFGAQLFVRRGVGHLLGHTGAIGLDLLLGNSLVE